MVRAGKAGIVPRHFLISSLILAAMGLSACVQPGGREATRAGSVLDPTALAGAGAVERDVEAPSVFNETETGLWDGRPSLGGVWVAHPGVRDPERVVIRNPANGTEVIGALFRRERDNPGPRFQISSEAAQTLGMLAGQPATIHVTALRLERIERPAAAAAPATDPAAAPAAPEAVAAAPRPAASAAETAAAGAAAGTLTEAGTVEIAALEPAEAPRRGLRGLFSRRDAAPAEAAPAIAETALAPVAPVAAAPLAAGAAAAAATTTAALAETPPHRPQAEAPRERRGLFGSRRAAEPVAEAAVIPMPEAVAAAPAPAAPAAPAAATASRSTAGGFIQVGIFSVEENATRTRARLRAAGLEAEVRRGAHGERAFWRVVVGPLPDAAARTRALTQVRGLGFADAYPVAR